MQCFVSLGAGLRPSAQGRVARRGVCAVRASIATSVSESLKDAMRAKDSTKVRALRGIRAALLNAMKEDGKDDLDDSKALAQLRKLAKMRRESYEAFKSGGRMDLAEAEHEELQIIETYLPPAASDEQIRAWAAEAIAATGAKGKQDFGKVMGKVMGAHRDDGVDGAVLKRVVTEMLS